MKVALLTSWLVKCGISSYSWFLSHALAQLGCEVYVVRLNRFGGKDEAYYRNYAEEVPYEEVDIISVQHEYGLFNWCELAFYSGLKTRMDLLSKRVPVVTTMHSTGNLRVDRIVKSNSDAVVVHNQHQANEFRFDCNIIPMGIRKVGELSPPEFAKRRWGVEGKTVGMFGFLSEYKGLETLIRAVAQMPDVTLLVGGGWHIDAETPYIVGIKTYAHNLAPNRVRFLGYVAEEDLANYFSACDVVVYGHQFISESMAVNTALAHRKAVLTSYQPAFIEKERENVLMTFRNVDDLAGKLRALLNEPELRATLEKNAADYAFKHSWEFSAKEHLSLFESLIKK